jgi:hypothetical protein
MIGLLRVVGVAGVSALVSTSLVSAQRQSIFTTGNEPFAASRFSGADCPDPQGGAQADTSDDTWGCWASVAESRPFTGSWLDVRVKPAYALVYVNERYLGTAQRFTKPFRPLRIGPGPQRVEFRAPGYRTVSFWINQENGRVATATGTLVKNP